MGSVSPAVAKELHAERQAERQRQQDAVVSQRMELSKKIATVVIDRINADIVRPGPKPEERECYVMAQELRETMPTLAALIADVIAQEDAD